MGSVLKLALLTAKTEIPLIHCSLVCKCCSAIQTLLQLNSNNYTICELLIYIALGRNGRAWAKIGVIGGFNRVQIRRNATLFMRN